VLHCIARLFEPLLPCPLPDQGRQLPDQVAAEAPPGAPRLGAGPAATPMPRPLVVLRGEDTVLVRPYLLAHERRVAGAAARRRPVLRQRLWFGAYGFDVEPCLLHGAHDMAVTV
jgi:hypothetical protein